MLADAVLAFTRSFFFSEARVHEGVALLGAVVPGAEPLIERDQPVAAVVHLEIFVVQVVRVGVAIERGVVGDLELVEAEMAVHRAEAGDMQLEQRDDRVGRDDKVPERHRVIEQALRPDASTATTTATG